MFSQKTQIRLKNTIGTNFRIQTIKIIDPLRIWVRFPIFFNPLNFPNFIIKSKTARRFITFCISRRYNFSGPHDCPKAMYFKSNHLRFSPVYPQYSRSRSYWVAPENLNWDDQMVQSIKTYAENMQKARILLDNIQVITCKYSKVLDMTLGRRK